MKKLLSILAIAVAIFYFTPHLSADDFSNRLTPRVSSESNMKAPVTAITFFSQNCGSCKILDPRMRKAMQAVNANKINVVLFDFTNKNAITQTKMRAADNGLSEILSRYGVKTGFIVLLDSRGQEIEKRGL